MPDNGKRVPLEDIIDEPVAITVSAEEIVNTDPFGDSKSFEVDKEIGLAQLQTEIEEACGHSVAMSLQRIPGNVSGILYVSPGDRIDGRTVVGKIKSHKPDPFFGLSDEDRRRREVIEKIRKGEVPTPEEMTIALQALLRLR